jgi:hypothetical protein
MFRADEHLTDTARDIVANMSAKCTKAMWLQVLTSWTVNFQHMLPQFLRCLQEGVKSDKAADIAAAAGIEVVMDKCISTEAEKRQGKKQTGESMTSASGSKGQETAKIAEKGVGAASRRDYAQTHRQVRENPDASASVAASNAFDSSKASRQSTGGTTGVPHAMESTRAPIGQAPDSSLMWEQSDSSNSGASSKDRNESIPSQPGGKHYRPIFRGNTCIVTAIYK